jgi:hypothetical protein
MEPPRHRNARAEAQALLHDDQLVAHVLEPSPPAVTAEPFADDPAMPSQGEPAVTPTDAGTASWHDLAQRRPELAPFVTEHWLGAWAPLPPVPSGFAATRAALHLVAFYVMSPARRAVNGRIGLRWTYGGFGTPFFGDDIQVRVEGTHLVVQTANGVRFEPLTSLRQAGRLVGIQPRAGDKEGFDAPDIGDLDAPLAIDERSVAFLGAWYGLAASVLEQLRIDTRTDGPGVVQLWPEHFDIAIETGDDERGQRAAYGFSPGDAAHPEPYVYVSPARVVDHNDPYWNDEAFKGASLPLRDLVAADDQRARALEYLRRGVELLSVTN